ncbi:MAG: AMP-binding protein, partial [Candidatus Hodarchaeota archaeon]
MSVDWLAEKMRQWGNNPAIVWRNQEFNYADILKGIKFWEGEIDSQNVHPGSVVALEGDYSPNVCALLLALIQRKAIVVPLTKADAPQREEFSSTAEVQFIFSFDDEDNWKIEKRGTVISNPLTKQLIEMNAAGLVLFSSGSTGKNKAALHSFDKFLEKFKLPRHRIRMINFLLFSHIGGFNTLFYSLSNGGTLVTTQDRDPENVCQLIEKHKVELLPTTPTFLNILLISEAYRNFDLSSLRLITYGTEVMPETILTRIHQTFPNVRLLQTYGLSELGILRSKSKDSDSAWMKVGGEGFEIKA